MPTWSFSAHIRDTDDLHSERIVHWEFARLLSIESRGMQSCSSPFPCHVVASNYLVVLDQL